MITHQAMELARAQAELERLRARNHEMNEQLQQLAALIYELYYPRLSAAQRIIHQSGRRAEGREYRHGLRLKK